MKKRANIIVSDVVFLVLTLIFITMLFIFVSRQSSNTFLLEEKSAKEIALMIDASQKGSEIKLNIEKILDKKENLIKEPIRILKEQRVVYVKLSEKSGYGYGFFNDVDVGAEAEGNYLILTIRGKK